MLTKDRKIEQLAELNDELENYFKNTIIPQLYIDGNLILQKFSPPAMKQFSLSAGDVGKSIADIKENLHFPTIVEVIQQVIESNTILEKEVQTADMRWYQMNIIPYVEWQNNKTNGVIITFVEITMRINDLIEKEKLVSDYETLLDTISHDIKGPVSNLVTAVDLFKNARNEDPEEYRILFGVLEKSIIKMKNVINELTDTRKQEHKYKAGEELLNFENILEDVCLTITGIINESGAIINKEIGVREITFSKRKLRSIIYNLVSNAIKFRSEEHRPEILVKTKREEDLIIISVKDNGIGIDESKLDTIFSKYYRVENDIEGSGIGLYLVKEIVTLAGGKVDVKSRVGKGTEFTVYLKA